MLRGTDRLGFIQALPRTALGTTEKKSTIGVVVAGVGLDLYS